MSNSEGVVVLLSKKLFFALPETDFFVIALFVLLALFLMRWTRLRKGKRH